MKEEIIKELTQAKAYLQAMKDNDHHKGDCDNVIMHLEKINDLITGSLSDMKHSEDSKVKEILLDELEQQEHPEKVEDVIFWALEAYCKSKPKNTWGRTVAYAIKERIIEEEKK